MEITELNILNDVQSAFKCIQNPSLISRFHLYTFCKWGALIVALLATFTSLINRIKLLIFRIPTIKSLASSSSFKYLHQILDEDFDYTDEDSSSEAESDEEELEYNSSIELEEDFRVAGSDFSDRRRSNSFKLRRRRIGGNRFSWSDFAAGKSVVQLWDGFGLGLDFDDDSFGSEVSVWDSDSGRNEKINSYFENQNPAVAILSPDVVVLAGSSKNDTVILSGYDKRVGCRIPAIYAEWKQLGCEVVNVRPGGVDKIYVKDGHTGGVTVGDIRNVKTPLENLKACADDDNDSWWDADGVTW